MHPSPWLRIRVLLGLALHITSIVSSPPPSVTLLQGTINGFKDQHNNSVYLGIPFAHTTAGENRWRAPQPLPNSTSRTFSATTYGATCPQAITDENFTRQDEDCLNLNIWAPEEGTDLPVFIYIYGGAMVTGSNSNPQIQGTNFARAGVIYVNFNMRESLWANPNSAELEGVQNFGILDVDAAVEWVFENIAAFGGNSSHIVMGGHSSGSVQVDHYLYRQPETKLAGAVEMSANALSGPAYAPPGVALDIVAADVGCPLSNQTGQLACLRNKTIWELETSRFNGSVNTWFTPVIDSITKFTSESLETRPYASHVPMLTGNSANEGRIFANIYSAENTNFSSWIRTFDADVSHVPEQILLDAYPHNNTAADSLVSGKMYGDARFDCPVDHFLTHRSASQQTWAYRFYGAYDNVVGIPNTAPTHGTEVPFFHGGNECFSSLDNVTVQQQELADSIHGWFVDWIKNPSAGPGWRQFDVQEGNVAEIGVPGRELEVLDGDRREWHGVCQEVYEEFWDAYPRVQSPV